MAETRCPVEDFWALLEARKGLGPSTVHSYKSVFRLTTKNGAWALRQLRAQWPQADWSAIGDLTQLPEGDRADMLDYLLRSCAEVERDSPLASHLKKLRSAIELYQELVLGRTAAPPPRTQAALRQEGPLCFSALLGLWATAAAPSRPVDQAKDWLRFLLRQLPDGQPSLSPGQLTRCVLLPAGDRALLLEALERTMAQIPSWDGETRRNYARFFHADPEVLTFLAGRLNAVSVPEDASPRVRRELTRLESLGRHWPALYQLSGGRSRTEGRLLLLRTMLSLLYGALGGDGDWLPPLERDSPTGAKFFSTLSQAGLPLDLQLAEAIRLGKQFDLLYRLPNASLRLVWTANDLVWVRNHGPALAQLARLSTALDELLAQPWMETNPIRAQAVLALTQLLAELVKESGSAPVRSRRSPDGGEGPDHLEDITRAFLSCWETPEQRRRLIDRLNPEWARLKAAVRTAGQTPLCDLLDEVSDLSEDYIDLLRAAADRPAAGAEERRRLRALAGQGAMRLRLAQEMQAGTRLLSPPAAPPADAAPCPLWDEGTACDYLRPYASSVFDAIRGFGPRETQMELVSFLYRSARVVLTAPQVVDNPQILGLMWSSPAFLELLSLGRVTVSLFRDFRSLSQYARSILAPESGFRFSGYPLFQDEDPVVRAYLRRCMWAYLNAEDRSGRLAALRRAPFEAWEAMSRYGGAIRLADEALAAQRCAAGGTLGGFFHQQDGWRRDASLAALPEELGRYLERELPHRRDLGDLHRKLAPQLPDDTRSALYAALALGPDRWETDQAVLDDYRVLVDLLCFECSSARITRFTEHRVEDRCRDLLPSGRGGAGPLSLAVGYDQRPLEGEDAPFTMEDVVRFAREADRLVALQPGTTSAAAILSQVLCSSRAVALGTSDRDLAYLTRLAYRVDDPDRAASQDLLQEASDAGSFLTLERRRR